MTNLLAQFKRLYTASRAAWPNTSLRLAANYVGSDAQTVDLIKFCAALRCAVGGPDVIPSEDIQANSVFSGEGGGTDYRGILPFVAEIQSPELGGHEGTWTPAQLYDHSMNGNASAGINGTRPQYFVWLRNTWSGGAAQQWSTGILPFIRSINGAVCLHRLSERLYERLSQPIDFTEPPDPQFRRAVQSEIGWAPLRSSTGLLPGTSDAYPILPLTTCL